MDSFLSPAARLKACTTIQFSKTNPILRRISILPLACDRVNPPTDIAIDSRFRRIRWVASGGRNLMRRELDVPRREEESSPHRPCAQVPVTKKLTLSSTGAINASLCLAFPMRRERYRWRFEGLRARPMRRELLAYADRVVLLGQLMRADFARPERGMRHSMARTEVARDGPAATNSNPIFAPRSASKDLCAC